MTMMVEPLDQAARRKDGVGEMYTIATLGSHSALQILKGAHDEGFKTLAIANRATERPTPNGSTSRSRSSTKSF